MSLLGVNMAIPVKDSNRDSQIYFLHSSDNNSQKNERRKYVIFKTVQLILSLCSLPIFAYSVDSTGKIEDMLICAVLGALIFYPLLFLFLSISVKRRSACLMAVNLSAFFILLAAASIIIVTWLDANFQDSFNKEQRKASALKLTSSILSIVNGVMYMIESLILFLELNGHLQSR